MHLAYLDESGDHLSYGLGCVLVPAAQWLEIHDQLVEFRRELSEKQGFRMRHELKATELISGGGQWHKLGTPPRTRHGVYRAALDQLSALAPVVAAFAVVAPDRSHTKLQTHAIDEVWDVTLQRLERFCFKNGTTCMIVTDDGAPKKVRTLTRRKRRFGYAPAAFGGQARKVPFHQLVDDPSARGSHTSYEVQWADLVAYSAFRTIMPRLSTPADLWSSLDAAQLEPVNELERRKGSNEPAGLVVWPERQLP